MTSMDDHEHHHLPTSTRSGDTSHLTPATYIVVKRPPRFLPRVPTTSNGSANGTPGEERERSHGRETRDPVYASRGATEDQILGRGSDDDSKDDGHLRREEVRRDADVAARAAAAAATEHTDLSLLSSTAAREGETVAHTNPGSMGGMDVDERVRTDVGERSGGEEAHEWEGTPSVAADLAKGSVDRAEENAIPAEDGTAHHDHPSHTSPHEEEQAVWDAPRAASPSNCPSTHSTCGHNSGSGGLGRQPPVVVMKVTSLSTDRKRSTALGSSVGSSTPDPSASLEASTEASYHGVADASGTATDSISVQHRVGFAGAAAPDQDLYPTEEEGSLRQTPSYVAANVQESKDSLRSLHTNGGSNKVCSSGGEDEEDEDGEGEREAHATGDGGRDGLSGELEVRQANFEWVVAKPLPPQPESLQRIVAAVRTLMQLSLVSAI